MMVKREPSFSPWGEIQSCRMICPGTYSVSTESHGGIMIRRAFAEEVLRKEALKCAQLESGWYCFEEDCAATVAIRELIDRRQFLPPVDQYWKPGEYERSIDNSVQRYYPEYWQAREQSMNSAEARQLRLALERFRGDER